jgi:Ca2+-transporting ATPase
MLVITASTLFAFRTGWKLFGGEEAARTMAFICLSGCQLVRAYTNRSERASVFAIGVFSNRWMQYAVLSSVVLLAAVICIPFISTVFTVAPLPPAAWAVLAPLVFLPAAVDELAKLAARFMAKRRAPAGG